MSAFKYTREYLKGNRLAIKCDNELEAEKIHQIYGGATKYIGLNKYFGDIHCGMGFYSEGCLVAYGESSITASEVITAYEDSKQPDRKIVGYKCPFDMFGGTIKKGSVYEMLEGHGVYFLKYDNDTKTHCLPLEIVEQWEPVYEEYSKPLFDSFSDIIKYFKGCKVVADSGDYILVSNQTKLAPAGQLIHYHLCIETGWRFSDSFHEELKELGIKI